VTMLGVLQPAPHTRLWKRLEKEGRQRQDIGDDMGTFSDMKSRLFLRYGLFMNYSLLAQG